MYSIFPPFLSFSLLLLCILFAILFQAFLVQSQSILMMQDIVVTDVTGCLNVTPFTFNCSMPANLVISTTGLPLVASNYFFNVRIQYNGQSLSNVAQLNYADRTRMSLLVTVQPPAYSVGLTGVLLNLTIVDMVSGNTSAPFPAFSFAPLPAPLLVSISGCDGSGVGTYNCAPDNDILTIQGSGLTWLQKSTPLITYPASKSSSSGIITSVSLNSGTYSFTLINDSHALLLLNQSYEYTVLPQHYNGTVLPLLFSSSSYNEATGRVSTVYTNALNISFIPLPPPSIASFYVSQCAQYSGANYTSCLPGVSYLFLTGHYLYLVQILVGGQLCSRLVASATNWVCNLPVIDGYTPDFAYDTVVVPYDGANITLSCIVAFTSAPTVSSVIPCLYQGTMSVSNNGLCQPGHVLTIKGSRFPLSDSSVQVTMSRFVSSSSYYTTLNVNCTVAVVLDSGTIACTLPFILNSTIAQQFYGQYVQVQASFSTSISNVMYNSVYNFADAPNVTAISGCQSSRSTLQISECLPEDVLQIEGTNLAGSDVLIYGITELLEADGSMYNDYQVCNVTSFSTTSITCVLPLWDEENPLLSEVDYYFIVTLIRNNSYMRSNAFSVTFTIDGPPAMASSSSSSSGGSPPSDDSGSPHSGMSGGAIAGLVMGLLALTAVLVGAALLMARRRRAALGKHGDILSFSLHFDQDKVSSDLFNDVEMH
jgi:hypothetical protein